ncbi:MAG: hypothetical protein OEZ58_13335, partial [Gammaproteobacteria bacterium]|nr:hypothetical protein [Gammaproteobacteria bacterium]
LIVPTIIGLSFGQTIGQWFALLMMSTWLGLIFLTLALWLSTYPWERAKLLGISIGLWLVLVILFDVGFIGLLVATSGELSNTIVENIFYINPASLLRFLMIQTMFDQSVINELGLQGSIPGVFSLLIALLIWSALPLVLAARKMSRY